MYNINIMQTDIHREQSSSQPAPQNQNGPSRSITSQSNTNTSNNGGEQTPPQLGLVEFFNNFISEIIRPVREAVGL